MADINDAMEEIYKICGVVTLQLIKIDSSECNKEGVQDFVNDINALAMPFVAERAAETYEPKGNTDV
jgi:hypothetical protein